MENSSSDIPVDRSQFPSFAQFLSVFGYILIIVGALIFIGELISNSRTFPKPSFEPIRVVEDASIMLCGLILVAVGQAITALRSVAKSCAEKSE